MGIKNREFPVVQSTGQPGSESVEGILHDVLRLGLERVKRSRLKVSPGQIHESRADDGNLHAALFITSPSASVLTGSQRKVIALAGHGLGNKDIARKLGRSPNTISNHMKAIKRKLGATSRTGIALYALIVLKEDMAFWG